MNEQDRNVNTLSRRQLLKYGAGGLAALVVGSKMNLLLDESVYAQVVVQELNFTITDAIKEMVTHQPLDLNPDGNQALQYFWIYKEANLPQESPGPIIFVREGDAVTITVTNALNEDHEFAIPGLPVPFTTDPIAPGATVTRTINVPANSAGTYLYFDRLNAPVNRVMGLHGAFVVMPAVLAANSTPYNQADPAGPHPNVVRLFSDLGVQPWFAGLAWGQSGLNGPPFPDTPAFRQYIWVLHEASPTLFAEVGNFPPGDFPAAVFVDRFLNNSFTPAGANEAPADQGDTPQYFTVSGQSGHFGHASPFITPHLRVGEPCVIRVLNAGLWTHCIHLHANHFYLLKVRNEITGFPGTDFNPFLDLDPAVVPGVANNQVLLDVFGAHPGDVYDWVIPLHRPPDVPNTLGIARPDLSDPIPVVPAPIAKFGSRMDRRGRLRPADTPAGVMTWPPVQELHFNIPLAGTTLGPLLDREGNVIVDKTPVHVAMGFLSYPMHDHIETSQTTQGGNYNQGMIAGLNFIGDRNADGRLDVAPVGGITVAANGVITFPIVPLTFDDPNFPAIGADDAAANERAVFGPDFNLLVQPPAGPVPPFEESMGGLEPPAPM